jgi:uncharacterized protein YbjT (DUF2867 family)
MFAIAGITGNTGSSTARELLARGHRVRGIVRSKLKAKTWANQGVELVEADFSEVDSLAAALTGVQGAYLLLPPNHQSADPIAHMQTMATILRDASKLARLERLVFLSSEGAHLNSGTGPILGLHLAENTLADAAPIVSFLRASYFQENWQPLISLAAAQGILPSMLTDIDTKRSMLACKDIGTEAANLLLDTSPPSVVELGSQLGYSPSDVAQTMSSVLGKPINLVIAPRQQWRSVFEQAGFSPESSGLMMQMYDGLNSNHIAFSKTAQARSGKTTLAQTLQSLC